MIDLNGQSLGAIALPFLGGFAGSAMMQKNMDQFYPKLKKPWWSPPQKAFPLVWSALYGSMGYASYMIVRDGGGCEKEARIPMLLYGGTLALNWAFTPLFFGFKKLGLATLDCGALWIGIALTIKSYLPVNSNAALLMLPYQAWVTLATALSFWVWKNNPEIEDGQSKTD